MVGVDASVGDSPVVAGFDPVMAVFDTVVVLPAVDEVVPADWYVVVDGRVVAGVVAVGGFEGVVDSVEAVDCTAPPVVGGAVVAVGCVHQVEDMLVHYGLHGGAGHHAGRGNHIH